MDRFDDGDPYYFVESSKVYPGRDVEYTGTADLVLSCLDRVLIPFISLPEEPVRYFNDEWELQDISWYAIMHTGWDDVARTWQTAVVVSDLESPLLAFLNVGPAREAYSNFMSDIVGRDYLELSLATYDYGGLTFEFPITGADDVVAKLPCDVDGRALQPSAR